VLVWKYLTTVKAWKTFLLGLQETQS